MYINSYLNTVFKLCAAVMLDSVVKLVLVVSNVSSSRVKRRYFM